MKMRIEQNGFSYGGVLLLTASAFLLGSVFASQTDVESATGVQGTKSPAALHLAQAAVERGRRLLEEDHGSWAATESGQALSGYNLDKVYADEPGGQYAVRIMTDPTNKDRRLVQGIGRDGSSRSARRIYAIFELQGHDDEAALALLTWEEMPGIWPDHLAATPAL